MKDETKKERKQRKKLEKKIRKLTQKLLSLEKKLRELQKPKEGKAGPHGAPKAEFKAPSESRREAKRRAVAKPKKTARTVRPKTAPRKARKATRPVAAKLKKTTSTVKAKTASNMPNKVLTRAPRITLPPPPSALASAARSVPTQSASTGDDHAKHDRDASGVT